MAIQNPSITLAELRKQVRQEEDTKMVAELKEQVLDIRDDLNDGIDEIKDVIDAGLQKLQAPVVDIAPLAQSLDKGFDQVKDSIHDAVKKHQQESVGELKLMMAEFLGRVNAVQPKVVEAAPEAPSNLDLYLLATNVFLEVSARIVNAAKNSGRNTAPPYLHLEHTSTIEGFSALSFRNMSKLPGLPSHLYSYAPKIMVYRNVFDGPHETQRARIAATYYDNGRHHVMDNTDVLALLIAVNNDLKETYIEG